MLTNSQGDYTISLVRDNAACHIKLMKKGGGWVLGSGGAPYETLSDLIAAKMGQVRSHVPFLC